MMWRIICVCSQIDFVTFWLPEYWEVSFARSFPAYPAQKQTIWNTLFYSTYDFTETFPFFELMGNWKLSY